MEECKICFSKPKQNNIKILKCSHELCNDCYLSLIYNECPYCRTEIIYTNKEKLIRKQKGINSNIDFSENIQYNINDFTDNNTNTENLSSMNTNLDVNLLNFPSLIISRRSRNQRNHQNIHNTQEEANFRRRKRSKRRRKLSDEEIQEKRKIINIKKKMKFLKKEGRLRKQIAWYNQQID